MSICFQTHKQIKRVLKSHFFGFKSTLSAFLKMLFKEIFFKVSGARFVPRGELRAFPGFLSKKCMN
jgi:hypothetical protein